MTWRAAFICPWPGLQVHEEFDAAGFLGLAEVQGLTLVHFSAQLEPCLSHEHTLHTLNTPLTRATQPQRAPPIPYKALKLS